MEGLYRELSAAVEPRLLALAQQPFVAADWRGQVLELIARRSIAFEVFGNVLKAALLYSYRSAVLMEDQRRLREMSRALFVARVPEGALSANAIDAIDLLLSFESWSRLRQDERLSVEQAKQVLAYIVNTIMAAEGAPVAAAS